MKRFVIKEFLHIFRDVRSMVILFGMPLVQVLLFGFAITNEVKDVKVSVVDPSHDQVTTAIRQKLFASGYFLQGEILNSQGEVEDSFRKGRNKMVVVFEDNFARKLERGEKPTIQLIADASDPNTANLLVSYANGIISAYNQSMVISTNGSGYNTGNQDDVQPGIEERFHVCAGYHHHFADAGFGHDDIHINCQGKGTRHDGSSAGFAVKASAYYCRESNALRFAFIY
jgi:hypothetical protein